ncbi:histidine phosphatase family protein [Catellatospora sichuanensis]|uniref:histidine phosphatase family protein n=1 Tax=Catellatospora sichuanensis TaxID=1969805 RepID=UPI0011825CA5|nr:histidine phosphatase family protein [Catellatospora sichuanensis]
MTRVLLWRHGNTDWNAAQRVQGQLDVPVNDRGRAQAQAAAAVLARSEAQLMITSDLGRCTQTAAPLVELTGLTPERDARLRERHFGSWQGLTTPEVRERFPESYARWRAADPDPGDGLEPLADLGKRVSETIRQAAERVPGGTAILVSHGGAIKYGVAALLGWPEEMLPTVAPVQNCHWVDLILQPSYGWRVSAYNVGA